MGRSSFVRSSQSESLDNRAPAPPAHKSVEPSLLPHRQMYTPLPTIRIKHDGFPDGLLINKSEFDPKVHTEFGRTGAKKSESDNLKPKTIAERLAALSRKEIQDLAKAVEIPANQTNDALIEALIPHVEGGAIELSEAN